MAAPKVMRKKPAAKRKGPLVAQVVPKRKAGELSPSEALKIIKRGDFATYADFTILKNAARFEKQAAIFIALHEAVRLLSPKVAAKTKDEKDAKRAAKAIGLATIDKAMLYLSVKMWQNWTQMKTAGRRTALKQWHALITGMRALQNRQGFNPFLGSLYGSVVNFARDQAAKGKPLKADITKRALTLPVYAVEVMPAPVVTREVFRSENYSVYAYPTKDLSEMTLNLFNNDTSRARNFVSDYGALSFLDAQNKLDSDAAKEAAKKLANDLQWISDNKGGTWPTRLNTIIADLRSGNAQRIKSALNELKKISDFNMARGPELAQTWLGTLGRRGVVLFKAGVTIRYQHTKNFRQWLDEIGQKRVRGWEARFLEMFIHMGYQLMALGGYLQSHSFDQQTGQFVKTGQHPITGKGHVVETGAGIKGGLIAAGVPMEITAYVSGAYTNLEAGATVQTVEGPKRLSVKQKKYVFHTARVEFKLPGKAADRNKVRVVRVSTGVISGPNPFLAVTVASPRLSSGRGRLKFTLFAEPSLFMIPKGTKALEAVRAGAVLSPMFQVTGRKGHFAFGPYVDYGAWFEPGKSRAPTLHTMDLGAGFSWSPTHRRDFVVSLGVGYKLERSQRGLVFPLIPGAPRISGKWAGTPHGMVGVSVNTAAISRLFRKR